MRPSVSSPSSQASRNQPAFPMWPPKLLVLCLLAGLASASDSVWRHTVLYKLKPSELAAESSATLAKVQSQLGGWGTQGPVKALTVEAGVDLGLVSELYPKSTFARSTNYHVGAVFDFNSTDALVAWWQWVQQQPSWQALQARSEAVARAQTVVLQPKCATPKRPVWRALFAYRLEGGKSAPYPRANYMLSALHWSADNAGAAAISYTQGLDLGLIRTLANQTTVPFDIAGTKDFSSKEDMVRWYQVNAFQLPNKDFGNLTAIIPVSARMQYKVVA